MNFDLKKRRAMKILLIFNKGKAAGVRVIVRLKTKSLQRKVVTLLQQERNKEAFEFVSNAIVENYLPPGVTPLIKPELTLVEEI